MSRELPGSADATERLTTSSDRVYTGTTVMSNTTTMDGSTKTNIKPPPVSPSPAYLMSMQKPFANAAGANVTLLRWTTYAVNQYNVLPTNRVPILLPKAWAPYCGDLELAVFHMHESYPVTPDEEQRVALSVPFLLHNSLGIQMTRFDRPSRSVIPYGRQGVKYLPDVVIHPACELVRRHRKPFAREISKGDFKLERERQNEAPVTPQLLLNQIQGKYSPRMTGMYSPGSCEQVTWTCSRILRFVGYKGQLRRYYKIFDVLIHNYIAANKGLASKTEPQAPSFLSLEQDLNHWKDGVVDIRQTTADLRKYSLTTCNVSEPEMSSSGRLEQVTSPTIVGSPVSTPCIEPHPELPVPLTEEKELISDEVILTDLPTSVESEPKLTSEDKSEPSIEPQEVEDTKVISEVSGSDLVEEEKHPISQESERPEESEENVDRPDSFEPASNEEGIAQDSSLSASVEVQGQSEVTVSVELTDQEASPEVSSEEVHISSTITEVVQRPSEEETTSELLPDNSTENPLQVTPE
ncbi:hypothetical protein CLF_108461 [Clonorchis sinensis]|uniref:Uncharacterized protein n=1 Tax=Clonorchis sinensis TaxID=79923 RepID=G7YI36_CLOSI|nr:hypothetical protein CLF_108461 [Clonorchis sinensis]